MSWLPWELPVRVEWKQYILNGDLADIVAYPPAQFKGIVALQILSHPEITSLLPGVLTDY
jgi:hypothetical protein